MSFIPNETHNFGEKAGDVAAPYRVSTEKTLEALARIFENFACPKMTVSGGEPLLREDLLDEAILRLRAASANVVRFS
jgi:molybdenum cofactor biosynthesis enzyme MoaA